MNKLREFTAECGFDDIEFYRIIRLCMRTLQFAVLAVG